MHIVAIARCHTSLFLIVIAFATNAISTPVHADSVYIGDDFVDHIGQVIEITDDEPSIIVRCSQTLYEWDSLIGGVEVVVAFPFNVPNEVGDRYQIVDQRPCGTSLTLIVVYLGNPSAEIEDLAIDVLLLNLHHGIENNLDAKLDSALNALDDLNANNDVAACNSLEAFVNAVEAQSGNQITVEDADYLIAQATEIILLLCAGS